MAVLSELNGNLDSPILFLAEAPGRNGGDKTRIPLVGDASGANFRKFIGSIGLKREDIFVSNTVLCNPRKESGANRKPSLAEIKNCSEFLQRQIEVLQPQIIVTLGTVALEALKTIEPHDLTVRENAGQIYEWKGRLLVPLYHPSPQVLASHRREKQQLFDYRAVAEALRRISATVEG
jgi:DNA polymerase